MTTCKSVHIGEATNRVLREYNSKHLPTVEYTEAKDAAIDALQRMWELARDGKATR